MQISSKVVLRSEQYRTHRTGSADHACIHVREFRGADTWEDRLWRWVPGTHGGGGGILCRCVGCVVAMGQLTFLGAMETTDQVDSAPSSLHLHIHPYIV